MSDAKRVVAGMSVENLMTSDVFCITPKMTIRSAIELLLEKKISGAPIVDDSKQILSVVSESDLMKFAAMGDLDHPVQARLDKLVPAAKVVTVRRSDTFKDVFKIFLTNRIRRVIVVDENGKLQGLITRTNILKAFMAEAKQDLAA